jgi:glycosyltransferase involved in cell wall biosynthesis
VSASDAPILYFAIGETGDRKGYVTAIRAFALGGQLGDRLTVSGYGRHRRSLERWAQALGVDAVVVFSDPAPIAPVDLSGFDALIVMSCRPPATVALMQAALARGLGVVAGDASIGMGGAGTGHGVLLRAERRNVLSYAHAIARLSGGLCQGFAPSRRCP